MKPQYAGASNPPTPTLKKIAGTSGVNSEIYVFSQFRCRGGYSLLSPSASINLTSSEGVEVTIPSIALASGWDIQEIIVCLSLSNRAQEALQCAAIRPGAGINKISMFDIEHFKLAKSVPTVSDLPGATALLGMRRYVNSESVVYEYNGIAWNKISPSSFSTYISSTSDPEEIGCDRDIRLIESNQGLLIPVYDPDIGGYSEIVKYWIANDSPNKVYPAGTRVRVSFEIANEDYSTEMFGAAHITPYGHVNIATGAIDKEDMKDIDARFLYQGDVQTSLILEKDLRTGEAYSFGLEINFTELSIRSSLLTGTAIRCLPRFAVSSAKYDEGGMIYGDYIASEYSRRLVLPTRGAGVVLKGSGRVSSYTFRGIGQSPLAGIELNNSRQIVAISFDGTVFVSGSTLPISMAQRALIGTRNGYGNITEFGNSISLGSDNLLEVSLSIPNIIRTDYPDTSIAGVEAECNAKFVIVYLKNTSTGIIRRYNSPVIIDDTLDNFVFTVGEADGNVVDDLNLEANFGLFKIESFTYKKTSATSNIPNANYQVSVGLYYENNITYISHAVEDGCIYEVDKTVAEVFRDSARWGFPVSSGAALRFIPKNKITPYQSRRLHTGELCYYDPESKKADDDLKIFKPDFITGTNSGRWIVDNRQVANLVEVNNNIYWQQSEIDKHQLVLIDREHRFLAHQSCEVVEVFPDENDNIIIDTRASNRFIVRINKDSGKYQILQPLFLTPGKAFELGLYFPFASTTKLNFDKCFMWNENTRNTFGKIEDIINRNNTIGLLSCVSFDGHYILASYLKGFS